MTEFNTIPTSDLRLRLAIAEEVRRAPAPYVRKYSRPVRAAIMIGGSLASWAMIISIVRHFV